MIPLIVEENRDATRHHGSERDTLSHGTPSDDGYSTSNRDLTVRSADMESTLAQLEAGEASVVEVIDPEQDTTPQHLRTLDHALVPSTSLPNHASPTT
ncbi:MAG: hypothetical protein R2749_01535 [Acidimicrobiales bacterium]